MTRVIRRLTVAFTLALAIAPASAQEGGAYLPRDHWSRDALRTLAASGAVPARLATTAWPATIGQVRAAFLQAKESANPSIQSLASAYADRLDQEVGDVGEGALVLSLGVETSRNGRLAGTHVDSAGWILYTGPREAKDSVDAALYVYAQKSVGLLSVGVDAGVGTTGAFVRSADLSADIGRVRVWGGLREFATGVNSESSVILSSAPQAVGGGIDLLRPIHLPVLGAVRGEWTLARMERSGPIENPFFSAARIEIAPTSSTAVGLTRAVIFGGNGNVDISPKTLAMMLIGLTTTDEKDTSFENQVAAADILWRFRTESGQAVALYSEWGFDDVGWGWSNVPAFILGGETGWVRDGEAYFVGFELTQFSSKCCGNPEWYLHKDLAEGWSDRGHLLGHPLGGHGRQTALRWRIEKPAGGFRLSGTLYERFRGDENVFAPERQGASAGLSLRVRQGVGGLGRVFGAMEFEFGDGDPHWKRARGQVGFELNGLRF